MSTAVGDRTGSAELPAALARIERLGDLDEAAMAATRARLDRLTKPTGSLGRLEELVVELAGITGEPGWRPARRTIVVFAADHGVAARGVSAYPTVVTGQMLANHLAGGAAINVLARRAGAEVLVVDVGVAAPTVVMTDMPPGVRFLSQRVRGGTSDMTAGPAMSRDEAVAAIGIGLRVAEDEAARGTNLIGTGEMGIGNTTAASAIAAVTMDRPVAEVTGRGTGIDDAGRARKIAAIERALEVNLPRHDDPIGVLAAVGGFEIAALSGLILGAASARIPVILDGFITGAAALVATASSLAVRRRLLASHVSAEAGHRAMLDHLGLRPLLDLDLRLGEGTGAALAFDLIDAACELRDEMATFESAGVSVQGTEPG